MAACIQKTSTNRTGWHQLYCGQPDKLTDRLAECLIERLVTHNVCDPKHDNVIYGLLCSYKRQLEAIRSGSPDRPIVALVISHEHDIPFGVVMLRTTTLPSYSYELHCYVKPDYRNQGYGYRMVEWMRSFLTDNYPEIDLSTIGGIYDMRNKPSLN